MEKLSNKALIETYVKAKDLGLAEVFISMVTVELKKRKITKNDIIAFRASYSELNDF